MFSVCDAHCTHCTSKEVKRKRNDSQVEEGKEEAEERKEKWDRGQSSHGVRSIERPIFFHPFSFLPPVPPVGPSVSLSPSVSVESRRMRALHLLSCLSSFFSAPIVRPTFRLARVFPLRLFPLAPCLTCVYPAILLSNLFRSSFRCRSSWRGGGAARRDAHADGKKIRGAQSAPELRRA